MSRKHLFEVMESSEEEIARFEEQANELRARLARNKHFAKLAEKEKKKYMKGDASHLYPLEEIAERTGIDRKTFRWLYRYLSSHLHGYPMSFYRMGDGTRGRGVHSESEESYIFPHFLEFSIDKLTASSDEMEKLFQGRRRA